MAGTGASEVQTSRIWLDGTFVPYEEARIHVLTHSLHYGYGVFEGLRCYRGDDGRSAIFRGPEHVRRLFDSAHILGIKIPFSQDEILKACAQAVGLNHFTECYIRPLVFLGDGQMGVAAHNNRVRVAIAAWEWGAYLGEDGVKRGIRLKTSSFNRFHPNTLMPHAKATGHYINSVLAVHEAQRGGYDEAMLLDVDGYVAEGSGENIFVVRDGVVTTPPSASALPGITRDAVIKILADLGLQVREQRFPRDTVYICDEVFMTGTAAEVTPVREVDDRTVGSGVPGPITRQVQETFAAALRGRDPRYRHWLHYV
ncbi:MAG TPA: branched-chain amino acid transaminase [Candidatus Binataceae bacterium]|nr:branched-chain amino acid transaminase [Candidatus Binataceae bacterium]